MNKVNLELITVVALIVLLILKKVKSVDCFSTNREFENEQIPDGIKFDYIVVGASGSGLIAVNSILENYFRNEEVNILLLDKGDEYKEHVTVENRNEDYTPTRKSDVNIYLSEDGYSIKESKKEGGRTSYGNVPFVAENVYTGDYYNSLGINLDMQKLQESYEYVRSVGDLIQPNIRTTWVLALERAFNDTEAFPVENGSDDLYENDDEYLNNNSDTQYDEYSQINNEKKAQEYNTIQGLYVRKMDLNKTGESNDKPSIKKETENEKSLYTSAYYLPYTFLTYGFRRGYKRRSGVRLIKNTSLNDNSNSKRKGNRLFRIKNFYVKKVTFFERSVIEENNNSELLVKCVEGIKLTNEKNLMKNVDHQNDKVEYCLKSKKGRIIITAGAINTPMILQRSGIGSIEDVKLSNPELGKPLIENKNVGKGLKDHPTLSVFGFFKGLNLNQTHIKSSNALFSRKNFGVNCLDGKEKDDIMGGCESITISEFEGFNIYNSWKNESYEYFRKNETNSSSIYNINDECTSLIRGISIHIPNPYSEGRVVWDDENKKPIIDLGMFSDLNDLLIMEAGFRRIIRLLRSPNIYSLLIPNIIPENNGWYSPFSGNNISNNSTNNLWRERIRNSRSGQENGNRINISRSREARNIDMIYDKCNLYSIFKDEMLQEKKSGVRRDNPNREIWSGITDYFNRLFNNFDANKNRQVINSRNEGSMRNNQTTAVDALESLLLATNIEEINASNDMANVNIDNTIKGTNNILNGDILNSNILKYTENKYEPSIWGNVPLILPKLPGYPSMIRDYVKRNTKSGNEFVGTASLGQVVKGHCFNVKGVRNLHILDESILNKHTNSDPIGTSMTLSRYAILNIIKNKCFYRVDY
ncbi:FAD NAD(P)-binding rossman fold oxidoreductase [Cryptosporidium xiaoi]|uniref:FAD NAD(P)-binding rossman fold oxidoreductase n=1 Tax=Cryptosporidium xiaoi TaxID=659607 RepID=A0AAV9XVW6_9CRYT